MIQHHGPTFPACEEDTSLADKLGCLVFDRSKDDDKQGPSIDDKAFLAIMDTEVYQDKGNSWLAPLPFRVPRRSLPSNKEQALKRLCSLRRTLEKKPKMKEHYIRFMQNMLDNDQAEPAPPLEDHRDYLLYLWYEDNDIDKNVVEYRMKVHVFGNSPSPVKFFIDTLLIQSSETINCSEPTTDALLSSLRASIFGKTEVRPVYKLKTPTNISVCFTLYGILDVDEKAQVFKTFIWVYLFWKIEGLSWDPVECGTDRISLPRKKLWMPDIVINEFMDENRVPDTYYLYVYFTGQVMDDFPFHVISSCNLDIYTFPFDIQNCTFTFNSYQHTGKDIQLFFQEPVKDTLKTSLDIMKTKGEWELVDMLAEKPEIPLHASNNSLDTLVYYIVLRRRATLYIVNLLIPSCFLITVDLFSFLLPPQSVDRSAFKMTLILGYTVFLLLMNDLLPVTGNAIPLINVFFSLCLALMVASLLETIVITNILCGSSGYPPLPQWVKIIFLNYLARIVCLIKKPSDQNCEEHKTVTDYCEPIRETTQSKANMKSSPSLQELRKISQDLLSIRQQVDKHFNTDQSEEEWVHFGQVIDRLLFGVYVVFLTVSFFTIVVFWVYWYNLRASLL
ncbi:5-hydroxytryptamine receptor 3C-like [Xyrauchen texanus]|uniref:5-hydroxytryptamine receptor 3C-like n=1 Tax=Xyrauchen texanus TaxID=154827 RepID=UPI0022423405|nr:5-hydroxytryptamine receptor 3C-like [Xyrauchen texanus]